MDKPVLLLAGDLAAPKRTVLGVLARMERLGLSASEERALLLDSGLPPIVLDEPELPITRDQELACLRRIVARLDAKQSVYLHALDAGLDARVTHFGALGLTMMYASSALQCAQVALANPELCWGHSRIAVMYEEGALYESFVVDLSLPGASAQETAVVRDYCITVDLAASIRLYSDVLGPGYDPQEVWLPYPAPFDSQVMQQRLGVKIHFSKPEGRTYFPPGLESAVPLLARPLAFRVYERLTRRLAARLREEVGLSEQVQRLLWASVPPLSRGEVAKMVAMSPRNLARRLANEGTSYAVLLQQTRRARAKQYLRSPELPLSQIASLLGFGDATAFSRAFRDWEGEPPSGWRRRAGAGQ